MLLKKYYAIYVEVPTGYPGVEVVYARDILEARRNAKNQVIITIKEAR